ncbi:hypothetical protein AB4Z52_27875 [Rhizobium sp. 2YAF20]|uniref:hypothetical protein n=1 Tax=Rhizobium sp. 2YAF20 TaxID=3233027 RepID=UPI003F9C68FC
MATDRNPPPDSKRPRPSPRGRREILRDARAGAFREINKGGAGYAKAIAGRFVETTRTAAASAPRAESQTKLARPIKERLDIDAFFDEIYVEDRIIFDILAK